MKQHTEFVTKVNKIKHIPTRNGKHLYSFSIPIAKMEGEEQLTEWLQCSILLKEEDKRLLAHKGEFHFTGSLTVKPSYKDYPQGLSLFGFEIEPVLGNVYRISKPKRVSGDATQARVEHSAPPTQAQSEPQAFPEMEASESVPF